MTDNLENLKKEQTKIDLLKTRLEHADQLAEDRLSLFHAEHHAHKNTRGWAKMLFVIIILFAIGFMCLLSQYSSLYAEHEELKQRAWFPKRNDVLASESFAVKYINQADSLFGGLVLNENDTATMCVPGPNGNFFKLLIIKND